MSEISTVRAELREKDEKNENLRKDNSRLATEKEALIAAKVVQFMIGSLNVFSKFVMLESLARHHVRSNRFHEISIKDSGTSNQELKRLEK